MYKRTILSCLLILLLLLPARSVLGEEWNAVKAAAYLDSRAEAWFAWSTARLGAGETASSCTCCHTLVPFAVARSSLREATNESEPSEAELRLLEQTRLRVQQWDNLDNSALELLYDFNAQKKKESWGTEAVLNAVVLAFFDLHQERDGPSDEFLTAMENLWKLQETEGDLKGSWDWLDFGLEPWESKDARYFGAAMAAVAIGTAPDYLPIDDQRESNLASLKAYLASNFDSQKLYNRVWGVWASQMLGGIMSEQQRTAVVQALFELQTEDGGWRLSSLGNFQRQDENSDGYATGLILHTLILSGNDSTDTRIANGLNWLKHNQSETGAWYGSSVNEDRDLTTHVGKFMADAATAYSVLALAHETPQ